MGYGFLIAGLAFKVTLVPFHAWAVDVYDGAPSDVSAFLAGGTKKIGLFAFFLVFLGPVLFINPAGAGHSPFAGGPLDLGPLLSITLGVLAVLTMTVGNVLALLQKEMKRMLAYSSISQAGYMLIGIAIGTAPALTGATLQIFAHVLMKGGAFLVVAGVGALGVGPLIDDWKGLGVPTSAARGRVRSHAALARRGAAHGRVRLEVRPLLVRGAGPELVRLARGRGPAQQRALGLLLRAGPEGDVLRPGELPGAWPRGRPATPVESPSGRAASATGGLSPIGLIAVADRRDRALSPAGPRRHPERRPALPRRRGMRPWSGSTSWWSEPVPPVRSRPARRPRGGPGPCSSTIDPSSGHPVQCGEFVPSAAELVDLFHCPELVDAAFEVPSETVLRETHWMTCVSPYGHRFRFPLSGATRLPPGVRQGARLPGGGRGGRAAVPARGDRRRGATRFGRPAGTSLEAQVVVGADGPLSTVARSVGFRPPRTLFRMITATVDGPLDGRDRPLLRPRRARGLRVGVPAGGRRSTWDSGSPASPRDATLDGLLDRFLRPPRVRARARPDPVVGADRPAPREPRARLGPPLRGRGEPRDGDERRRHPDGDAERLARRARRGAPRPVTGTPL